MLFAHSGSCLLLRIRRAARDFMASLSYYSLSIGSRTLGGRTYVISTSCPHNPTVVALNIRSSVYRLSLPCYFRLSTGHRCDRTFRSAASSSLQLHGRSGRIGNVENLVWLCLCLNFYVLATPLCFQTPV